MLSLFVFLCKGRGVVSVKSWRDLFLADFKLWFGHLDVSRFRLGASDGQRIAVTVKTVIFVCVQSNLLVLGPIVIKVFVDHRLIPQFFPNSPS